MFFHLDPFMFLLTQSIPKEKFILQYLEPPQQLICFSKWNIYLIWKHTTASCSHTGVIEKRDKRYKSLCTATNMFLVVSMIWFSYKDKLCIKMIGYPWEIHWNHGLRTPNEGINQRYLKNWADVADKIRFGRTYKLGSGSWFLALHWRQVSQQVSVVRGSM